jgi:spore photoproduct lyase
MKRHRPDKSVSIAKNTNQILTEINSHVAWLEWPKVPNQTHEKYYTYDISCNEDFALHAKHHDWQRIFKYFRDSDRAMASFATKIIPKKFLEFDPKGKVRIRFSVMPQDYSTLLEPNTPAIIDRLKAIDVFIEAGYDVHINYSPIIYRDEDWSDQYKELFRLVDKHVQNKDRVFAECIFLTHNKEKHEYNLIKGLPGEELLWQPEVQETKKSEYGGKNIRYAHGFKHQLVEYFKRIHKEIIPWNTIRYIF